MADADDESFLYGDAVEDESDPKQPLEVRQINQSILFAFSDINKILYLG